MAGLRNNITLEIDRPIATKLAMRAIKNVGLEE